MEVVQTSRGQETVDDLSGRVRLDKGNGRLVIFDGQHNIAILGYDDKGKVAVKVAKPGFDANTADDKDLIFNSNQNVFKIIERGTSSIPQFSINGGSGTTLKIPLPKSIKDQGIVPIAQVYAKGAVLDWSTFTQLAANYIPLPIIQSANNNVNGYLFEGTNGSYYPVTITTLADNDNLYVIASYPPGAATNIKPIPITYFLLQETAA